MKPLAFFCLLLPAILCARSFPDAQSAFAFGNIALAEGRNAEAADAFAAALQFGESANLHFNLAIAFARDAALVPARFHYFRALQIDPNHAEAAANLQILDQSLPDLPPIPTIAPPANWLAFNAWALTAAVGLWALLFAIATLWRRRLRFLTAPLLILAILTLPIATIAILQHARFAQFTLTAADNAPLRVAPVADSPAEITLPAATPVRILQAHGDFLLAQSPSGSQGFLHASETFRSN